MGEIPLWVAVASGGLDLEVGRVELYEGCRPRVTNHFSFSIESATSQETPSVLGKPVWLVTKDAAFKGYRK